MHPGSHLVERRAREAALEANTHGGGQSPSGEIAAGEAEAAEGGGATSAGVAATTGGLGENVYRRRADGAALSSDEHYEWKHALPIQAKAGGLILFDRDLVHAGGPNISPAIRYALYYRLRFEPSICQER